MDDQKKKTAAIAAVLAHIHAEEELQRSSQAATGGLDIISSSSSGLWSFSANQNQMMLRNLIQMRIVPGLKG
jgi:hypothetical protein